MDDKMFSSLHLRKLFAHFEIYHLFIEHRTEYINRSCYNHCPYEDH